MSNPRGQRPRFQGPNTQNHGSAAHGIASGGIAPAKVMALPNMRHKFVFGGHWQSFSAFAPRKDLYRIVALKGKHSHRVERRAGQKDTERNIGCFNIDEGGAFYSVAALYAAKYPGNSIVHARLVSNAETAIWIAALRDGVIDSDEMFQDMAEANTRLAQLQETMPNATLRSSHPDDIVELGAAADDLALLDLLRPHKAARLRQLKPGKRPLLAAAAAGLLVTAGATYLYLEHSQQAALPLVRKTVQPDLYPRYVATAGFIAACRAAIARVQQGRPPLWRIKQILCADDGQRRSAPVIASYERLAGGRLTDMRASVHKAAFSLDGHSAKGVFSWPRQPVMHQLNKSTLPQMLQVRQPLMDLTANLAGGLDLKQIARPAARRPYWVYGFSFKTPWPPHYWQAQLAAISGLSLSRILFFSESRQWQITGQITGQISGRLHGTNHGTNPRRP